MVQELIRLLVLKEKERLSFYSFILASYLKGIKNPDFISNSVVNFSIIIPMVASFKFFRPSGFPSSTASSKFFTVKTFPISLIPTLTKSPILIECSKSSKAELILVCGNVGDGKSHILSHLNNKLKEGLDNFKIHNDATESHNPKETSNDTLNRVLEDFKDININKSNKKLILAINLGTLSKFQEEYEVDYKQLFDYVKEQKILDADIIHHSKYDNKSNFHHVNFTDYHMYSLSSEGPKSIIISTLGSSI